MSRNITPQQQEELQRFQQMSQQLTILHQNYVQMETRKREIEKTLETVGDLDDDTEVYRTSGQILFKSTMPDTKKDLGDQLELLTVRVNQAKKQVESLEKQVKSKESELRASME